MESTLIPTQAKRNKWHLKEQSIGPDILADIEDKALIGIGILTGDVVCLKKGSLVWWNGPNAKWKCSNAASTDWTSLEKAKSPILNSPPKQRVAYEKKFHDCGGCHFTGPPMIASDGDDGPKDYDLWYLSIEHRIWLPVPKGYTVCEDKDPFNNLYN